MFFFLGVLLVLLGIGNSLNLPILNQITSDMNFKWTSLILGILCLFVSVIIFYRPPKESEASMSKKGDAIGQIPEELKMTFTQRRALLSVKQGEILAFLTLKGYDGQLITQEVIQATFSRYGYGLFYRLEHLRLLGFLIHQKIGKDLDENELVAYKLSPDYLKELGDPKEFAKLLANKQFNVGNDITVGSQRPRKPKKDVARKKK